MSAELIRLGVAGESKKAVQLDWYSEVEQTAKQAGVPLFEHVICRPTTTVRRKDSSGSIKVVGSESTYTTLEEFVGSIALPGRSGFEWAEWELKARAASIAKQYNISAEFHPQEVVEFFEDAKRHLEREPADAQELWHVLTLTNKNRSDARIAELKSQLDHLNEEKKEKESKAYDLELELDHLTCLLGSIPEDFADRFGTAANLVSIYEKEREKTRALKEELNETFLELKANAEQIKGLKRQLAEVQPAEAGHDYKAELNAALEEAEQARKFLIKIQDRKNSSAITIEQKEKTIGFLRALNRKLTATIRDKNAELEKLGAAVNSGKQLNKKLTSRIRQQVSLTDIAKSSIAEERAARVRLMAQLHRARRTKLLALISLALVGSFTVSMFTYFFFW
ncbi:hypothetical protein [Marinobacter sp.]|uniref:hypothetical protein n=1 Tax=Marinobacter sp. TaxID=50741 RepID=UPI00356AEBA4